MKKQTRALLAIILAAIFGGSNSVMTKIGLREIPPLSFAAYRFILASIIVLPIFVKGVKTRRNFLRILGVSLFAAVNITFFVYGIRLTGATISQVIYSFVPVMVGILSYFLIKERITLRKIAGITLGLLGVIITVVLPTLTETTVLRGNLKGNLLIFIGAILFSFYPVLSKSLQKENSPMVLTSGFIITAALLHIILAVPETILQPSWWVGVSWIAWLAGAVLAIFGTVIFYWLWQISIQLGTPTTASMLLYLQPITAFGWANILLGEKLIPGLVISGMMILGGAYLTTQAES